MLFFQKNELLLDIDEKVDEFKHFIKRATETISSVKLISEVQGEELSIRKKMMHISMLEEEQKYEQMVAEIIALVDYAHALKFGEALPDLN